MNVAWLRGRAIDFTAGAAIAGGAVVAAEAAGPSFIRSAVSCTAAPPPSRETTVRKTTGRIKRIGESGEGRGTGRVKAKVVTRMEISDLRRKKRMRISNDDVKLE